MIRQKKGEPITMKSSTNSVDAMLKKKNKKLTIHLRKYETLNERIMSNLLNNLEYFRNGEFDNIDTSVNSELGILLSDDIFSDVVLSNVSDYIYNIKTFEEYRLNAHRILDGLVEALLLHKTNLSCKTGNESYAAILKDKESTSKYLIQKYGGSSIFGDKIKADLTVMPTLKEEYMIYIERYGLPPKLKFKSELLSEILRELNCAGE